MARRGSNRARNAWTLGLLEVEPGHRVLELGFGPGYAISRLAPRLTTACVVGLDHSATMLAQARRRNAAWIADGRVQLVLGAIEAPQTLPRGFDRVYSANFLQFVPDREALLRDPLFLLVPGGRLATTDQPRHPGATDADALRFAEERIGRMRAEGYVDCHIEKNPHHGLLTVCVPGRKPWQ